MPTVDDLIGKPKPRQPMDWREVMQVFRGGLGGPLEPAGDRATESLHGG
jgi:hypothetical protein